MITKSVLTFIFLVLTVTVNGKSPSKIYNGEWAKEGEFGFVVSIIVNNRHFCGGSIITDIHVLTAARCLAPITRTQFVNMAVRSHTIDSEWGGQIYRVRRMWTHRYYSGSDPASLHDIGLIEGQICTTSPRGYGLCHGDSGGPLITREGKLVELVSWGIPCAQGSPDVFTNVPLYYEWITNIITQT